ncbi:outer membrane beta-barrel protein [Aliarcobacter butzleri]|uniref:outer membrane beta-barrel protein n=1 Tax=Aliarcobacter butzleri TaxID=28197 RepID=UPI00344FC9A9
MFKKLTLAALAAATLTSAASAIDIHVGASSVDAGRYGSGIEYSIGYGWDNRDKQTNGTGFYWGGSFDLGMAQLDTEDLTNFSFDLKLGYSPVKDLAVYAIGSGAIQGIEDTNSYGFGYGAGVDYKISDSFAVAAEYKTYTMTPDINGYAGVDYDYDKIGVNLKYVF